MKYRLRPLAWLFVLAGLVVLLAWAAPQPARGLHRAAPDGPPTSDSILLFGGTIVRRRAPNERLDLLLTRRRGYLVLTAVAEKGQLEAPDTLDISGLYLHSADMFDATVDTTPSLRPNALSIAMYLVREGAAETSPARWRIDGREIRRIRPEENHPPGPMDDRVGCYALERGEWSGPSVDRGALGEWGRFPDTVRLSWQYHLPVGPDPYLVATGADGRVDHPKITYYAWTPVPPDSVEVIFSDGFVGMTFRGVATAGGLDGQLSAWSDGGFYMEAPARLRSVECPEVAPAELDAETEIQAAVIREMMPDSGSGRNEVVCIEVHPAGSAMASERSDPPAKLLARFSRGGQTVAAGSRCALESAAGDMIHEPSRRKAVLYSVGTPTMHGQDSAEVWAGWHRGSLWGSSCLHELVREGNRWRVVDCRERIDN